MTEPKCTVVMYHYVRDAEKTAYPKIKAMRVADFEKQLDYLQKTGKIIDPQKYVEYLEGTSDIPENSYVLTFDDGLADHHTTVFPILKKRGLKAAFFPITQPLTEGAVPAVHRLQFLLATLDTPKFITEFNKAYELRYPEDKKYRLSEIVPEKLPTDWPVWRFADPLTSYVKAALSKMDSAVKQLVLDDVFKAKFPDERAFCEELFANTKQLREMADAGMTIGSHTHTHPALPNLSPASQKEELETSKKLIKERIGIEPAMLSYPNGLYDDKTVKIAKSAGYTAAVTIEPKINTGRVDAMRIGRLDCIELPPIKMNEVTGVPR